MSLTEWKINNQDLNVVKTLSKSLNCCDFISRLLINRGVSTPDEAVSFLTVDKTQFKDPFLLKDMDKAVSRIKSAVEQKERVLIYGDYDVDGITSISILYLYFKELGLQTDYYIPNRVSEGYGINESAIDRIAQNGCDLIITVDTGISAVSEAEYIKSKGIDLIITDHHECPDNIPSAIAVIDPKRQDDTYPFKQLAGVGVAFKLICALDKTFKTQTVLDKYSSFVAFGTIADMMSLIDENRFIVKLGLSSFGSCNSVGLKSLIKSCIKGDKVNSTAISFILAPKINAAGRIADAGLAVELFTTDNAERAEIISDMLLDFNMQRQQIELSIYKQAVQQIEIEGLNFKYNALVLWGKGWHNGIIGIVASKLKEKYHLPVFLFAIDENSDTAKGSGRSVPPFDLYGSLEQMSDITESFGGHKDAAGAVIKQQNLVKFRDTLSELAGQFLKESSFDTSIAAECCVEADELSTENAEQISWLEPFGKSNQTPVFCFNGAIIESIYTTANQKHLRLILDCGGKKITAFLFNKQTLDFDYRADDRVDLLFEMSINEYNNIKKLQFIIRDIRYSSDILDELMREKDSCDALTAIAGSIPSRNEIAAVYKYLLAMKNKNKTSYDMFTLPRKISADTLINLNYSKVRYSVDILIELKVIDGGYKDDILEIRDINTKTKVNLLNSKILHTLEKQVGELVEH